MEDGVIIFKIWSRRGGTYEVDLFGQNKELLKVKM
jgi:hypothetical protein